MLDLTQVKDGAGAQLQAFVTALLERVIDSRLAGVVIVWDPVAQQANVQSNVRRDLVPKMMAEFAGQMEEGMSNATEAIDNQRGDRPDSQLQSAGSDGDVKKES